MSNQTKLRRLCSLTLVALQWTVFRVTGSAPQMAERSPVVVATVGLLVGKKGARPLCPPTGGPSPILV
jgi:hypothetical protein